MALNPSDVQESYPLATSGLAVIAGVALNGTGITRVKTPTADTMGMSVYQVKLNASGTPNPSSVLVNVVPVDVNGTFVGGTPIVPVLQPVVIPPPPVPVPLLTASTFDILGGSTVTAVSTVTVTGGDLGLYPGTSVTGPFAMVLPGTEHITDGVALQAQNDLEAAYVYFSGLTTAPGATNIGTADMAGTTFTPGVYFSASSLLNTGVVTLNGQNNPNAVFVFVAGAALTAAGSVVLINGAQAGNVYWVTYSGASINGTAYTGNIIAQTGTIAFAAAVAFTGRALAHTGAVTFAAASTVNAPVLIPVPAPVIPPGLPTPVQAIQKVNAVCYNSLPATLNPQDVVTTYPIPLAYLGDVATVDDGTVSNDASPFTVAAVRPGVAVVEFQLATFGNAEGQHRPGGETNFDEFPVDMVYAQLQVTIGS